MGLFERDGPWTATRSLSAPTACVIRCVSWRAVAAILLSVCVPARAEGLTEPASAMPAPFIGPAFGTTYRVQCARLPAGRSRADLHRAIEEVLAGIDRAASTWRADSDASRLGDAAADDWVPVAPDLLALVALARAIHERSDGAFDITVAPLVAAWGGGPPRWRSVEAAVGPPTEAAITAALARVGMQHVESRASHHPAGPALRMRVPGMRLDLSGIAPGHAVDRIGTRLHALGSTDHLVELGGEVRAWGRRDDRTPWRVAVRMIDATVSRDVPLADGEAIAVSTIRPGQSPLDPRTGRPPTHAARQVIVRARSCAIADAWAVACLVLGSGPPRARADTAEPDLLPLAVEFIPAADGPR